MVIQFYEVFSGPLQGFSCYFACWTASLLLKDRANIHNYSISLNTLPWAIPDISPAKMGLFEMSRELQFGLCNHGKPHASPHKAREEHFYREEKEFRMATVNRVHGFSLAETCQERRGIFLPSVGICYFHRAWELPLLVSQLYLLRFLFINFFTIPTNYFFSHLITNHSLNTFLCCMPFLIN